MESLVYEPIMDKHVSIYLVKNYEDDAKFNEIKILMGYFNHLPLDFAIIDLGDQTLNDFNQSPYAKILEILEIPCFTIELPDHIKNHYSNALDEINYKLDELKSCYNGLENKNFPEAQEMQFLIGKYSKDIEEIKKYLNFKYRPQTIIKKILNVTKGREQKKITFAHIGDEKTFPSIMKLLKSHNIKSNVLFVHKS